MNNDRLKFPSLLITCFKYNLYVISDDNFFNVINELVKVKLGIEDTSFNINSWDVRALLDIVDENNIWNITTYIEFVCVLRKLCESELTVFYEMIGKVRTYSYSWINIARNIDCLEDIVKKHFPNIIL